MRRQTRVVRGYIPNGAKRLWGDMTGLGRKQLLAFQEKDGAQYHTSFSQVVEVSITITWEEDDDRP